jgi:hypothetical protein
MDLGFLPSYLPLAISGRLVVVGPMGAGAQARALPATSLIPTATQIVTEPIRLTLDASKVLWGEKYSHFVDVWVAYKYEKNLLGIDSARNPACANNTCIASSVYTGITVKF